MSYLDEVVENILQRDNLPSQEKNNDCILQEQKAKEMENPLDECHFGDWCHY